MKNAKTYFEIVLGKYISDIGNLLEESSSREKICNLENLIGKKLPEDFVDLYSNCDGENKNVFGLFAGFKFMNIDSIANNYKALFESAYKIFSDKKDVIKEGDYRKGWVPFASDEGGSYLVLDLDPDKLGKYGQVITIDENSDISYVIANSLKEFIDFIDKSFKNKDLIISEDDEEIKVIQWQSGHLFDDIIALTNTIIEKSETFTVTGFWKDYLKHDIVDGKISREALAQRKMVFINPDKPNEFEEASLKILNHMVNLQELIIHVDTINNFSFLKDLKSLKKLIIGSKAFNETDLKYVRCITELKELTLVNMHLNDISTLQDMKSLKSLRMYNMEGFDTKGLAMLTGITALSLEKISNIELSHIGELKKLKKLELEKINMPNLNFLKHLTKLTAFKCDEKATDESSIKVFEKLIHLKELEYPIGDMEVIKNCKNLKDIIIDAPTVKHLEYLNDLNITSVMVYNASSEENAEKILEEIKKHCKLSSFGWRQDWKD